MQPNMPRIGIRMATTIIPPSESVLDDEASSSSLPMAVSESEADRGRGGGGVGAQIVAAQQLSGLPMYPDRVGSSHGDTVKGDLSCSLSGDNKENSCNCRSSSERSRRPTVTVANWIFLPSIIFTSLIGLCSGGFQSNSNNHLNSIEASTPTPLRNLWADPYFDIMMPKNVTALVGKSAYLTCRVRNLGNRTVAWVRHRDIHVLTVNTYTYTSDQRFQTAHHKDTDEWTLHIKWAQPRDAGKYECQVSTQPVKSYIVSLNVVVPTASILGGPDLYVDKGSTINLTCAIQFSPEPPAYIFWYHLDEVISYDSTRGGVAVFTDKGEGTTSNLLIQKAELTDSGKYSCSPSNADMASVRVHVLNGERPEAMQTGSAGLSSSYVSIPILIIISSLYNSYRLTVRAPGRRGGAQHR